MSEARATGLSEQPLTTHGIERYELPSWRARFGVVAGITGRGFDLGLDSRQAMGNVLQRWRQLQADVFPRFPSLVVSRQVHEDRVAHHAALPPGILIGDGWDGHVTSEAGLLLCVTVADCVPVFIVDRQSRAVGLVHAGWRGVAAGIVERGIQTMCRVARCAGRDLVIHCGTSICGNCYEVGPEVLAAVAGRRGLAKGPLDLRSVIVDRAWEAGARQITVSSWCTAHDADRFESHRGSGGVAGRMVAFLGRLPS